MTSATSPRPYGSWRSPISASRAAAEALRISDPQLDGSRLYWVEGRPAENGRCAVVRHEAGRASDVLPAPFSARNTVHEYGGGALRVADGVVYFTNMSDQRVYRVDADGPVAVTPDLGDVRYADLEPDRSRGRLLSVVEDHRGDGVVNDIRAIDLADGTLETLVSGDDFYSAPRLSPDGTQLAWLTWNQPQMPWDGTELWLAGVDAAGRLTNATLVAGGIDESIFQPAWSPNGILHFCSDRTGFWNLYRVDGEAPRALAPMDADCGEPLWAFGLSTYAFCDEHRIVMITADKGMWRLRLLDTTGAGALITLELPFTTMRQLVASGDRIATLAGGPRHPRSVVAIDARSGGFEVLRTGSATEIDSALLSEPQPIHFTGSGGAQSHAFYYPPKNDEEAAPTDELPPLVVHAHGGPTGAADSSLSDVIQYWTSRGFAYVDVNYGGSAGYGREYRRRLNGMEGVVDVEDCIAAGQHLARTGLVDGSRMVVTGGSAGGYIVLCAMTFHDVFAAGAAHYGIADWETLISDTHKFEARYFDSMIGPYPERRDLYFERSPIHFIDRVRKPVIIFQGLEDRIVPPAQSQMMFDALRERGIPCAYIAFPGEQHGFRQSEHIERALEAERLFYCRVLHIEPPDAPEAVDIANEDRL